VADAARPPVEHAILALKPDGYGDPVTEETTRESLAAYRLEIVAERDVHFPPVEVVEVSHRTEPEYLDYLSSGSCRVFLVRGVAAIEASKRLKHDLRERFGVALAIRNRVHTVDAGKEMADWLGRFFPAHDRPPVRGFADEFWAPSDLDVLRAGLEWAAREHPGGRVIPVVPRRHAGAGLAALLHRHGVHWVGLLEPEPDPRFPAFEDVRYAPVAGPEGVGDGVLRVLGRSGPAVDDCVETLREAADAGFQAVLANSDHHDYFHLDLIEEAGLAAGMLSLTGSAGSATPFVTATSHRRHGELLDALGQASRTVREGELTPS
jgi:hypothetical protein